ncbi:MAG: nitrous oxide reductase family maturation protein NosD [Rhodothermales bacterium]
MLARWTLVFLLALSPCAAARAQARFSVPNDSLPTIAEAIRRAPAGGEVVVRAGVWREHGLLIDKPLRLIGEAGAVLDGDGEPILRVTADSVRVQGLVFRNVATSFVEDQAGIKLDGASRCVIEDNRFEDTFFALYLARTSHCILRNNVMQGAKATESRSGNGIHLWYSRYVTIAGNRISGHRDGIYLEFVEDSEVTDNHSTANLRYGLHFMFSDRCVYRRNDLLGNDAGVAVMYTKNVEMTDNRFEDNWGSASYGLLLKDITDSVIRGNTFRRNTIGIYAEGSDRMDVRHNTFEGNGWALKLMANAIDNRIEENNFVANTFDVATNSRQTNSTFAGNYWDKYRGYDLNRDGVGDVPFRPVRLFSLMVEANEPSIILLRSFFIDLLDAAERVLPSLTPETLVDNRPALSILP